ncbi:fibrinogen-binding protein [Rhizobium helianthi]|uniref:Fibrinogen-binding protein n=1 Tax=Rhizobium helianthi TaxID=1132695 RepID=A0ABW4M215_9HYPH
MPFPMGSNETNNIAVGALAEGFANSAINSTEVDEGSTGYVGGVANGDNRDNTDNSVDLDLKANLEMNNGSNRDNSYDWDYDSKSYSDNDNISDNDTQVITNTETKVSSDYDWSYDSKSVTSTNTETDIKTDIDTDTKTITTSDDDTANGSYNKADTDFAVLEDVKDFGNLGIAGGDLTFNLGDDFSFTLDVDNILNDSLNGDGNDSGFSAVQANHLADQDAAWEVRMENAGAENHLSANAGEAHGAIGMDMDGKGWDLEAGDDAAGTSTADASAILANSGFHFEFVQGANMLSNAIDSSVIGGDSHTSTVGEDTGA